jgi:histidyl-tRNA synthetase
MSTLKAVRGTRDLLPPETELWNHVEATARRVFARYNFGEIRTPIFEDTTLFARGVGEETDIVSKEMYTWLDGERFQHHELERAWLELHAGEVDVLRSETYVGPQGSQPEIDLVVKMRGQIELVQFTRNIDLKLCQDMRKAGDAWQMAMGQSVSLRIVVPNGTRFHREHISTFDIWVEDVSGNFFVSSQSLTLRPENTAGVVRAYIEHKLGDTGLLQKLYYIGPQFRRERPQKGRYRQFWQIGAEVIGPASAGSESPLRDAEVLEMLATFLDELGIRDWKLALNSVGSASDRPRYIAALREALKEKAAQLCEDCQRRAETNPLRVLDCKVPEDQPVIDALPKIAEYLDEASQAHFAAVCAALDACGVRYEISPRLVRGLDYYTRTTFEFTHAVGLGTQNALLGGGRYDGLSEAIGGPKAPGIGFAIGEDRLILTLQAQAAESAAGSSGASLADAYLAPLADRLEAAEAASLNAAALQLARELRRAGLRIELGDGSFRLKKSFEFGNKLARKIILFGEDERNSGMLTVKDFATGEQGKVARAEVEALLRR